MPKRLIVVPRWSGTPASDWYPWLERELASMSPPPFAPIIGATVPDSASSTISNWMAAVRAVLGTNPGEIADTVLVGHSVGCQAVLRVLAELPEGVHAAGVLCVAGWFWTDAPWASLMPWIDTPFDLERAKIAAGAPIVVLISDNDPHTSDWKANRAAWRDRLGATSIIVHGAAHFNGGHYPIILETLAERFT
ncbi:MAG TPA: alpha/beta hydrolase [Devosiaceae bacterium]|nr:alpha/beta hydrolase [Devosiaceae bacterium]